jgi:hypothetical protein
MDRGVPNGSATRNDFLLSTQSSQSAACGTRSLSLESGAQGLDVAKIEYPSNGASRPLFSTKKRHKCLDDVSIGRIYTYAELPPLLPNGGRF